MFVAIVEDDTRYRRSLETLFAHAPGFTLAGSYGSAEAALRAREGGEAWGIVLMDVELPGMSGIEATRRLKRSPSPPLVVHLTVFEDPSVILEAICAGADGYLLKKSSSQELMQQLQVIVAGGAPLTAGVARTVLDLLRAGAPGAVATAGAAARVPDPGLSPRELDVLRGLVRGYAYKQVAAELGVSLDTVRTHIRGIYRKLQVHSVAEAVTRAVRSGLA